ncbi:MAG TPA: hypothetical protein IAA29_18160, partial [Candidatus Paenibacillus intestinavium]|nr:hypothetical protein [Candidatus Paenibacillus intestinavium]
VMPLKEDIYSYICVDTRLMQLAAVHSEIFTLGEALTYYRKHDVNDSKKYGDINIYRQFTSELYDFFNSISVTHGYEAIRYSHTNFLENTLFFNDINIDKCNRFISNNEYWIWGAGEAGQSIYHALRKKKGELMGFIDSDPRKHGHMIMERKIYAPDNIGYNENIKIIVSPYHAYDAIKNNLLLKNMNEGFQFIDPYIRKD